MKDNVIRKAEAYLDGMVVLDRESVAIKETPSTVEVGYKGSTIELPVTEAAAEDAARFVIGAAVYFEAERSGRYLYSGSRIE